MRVCYLDEAGCTGSLPTATSPIQPVFVAAAVVFDQSRLHNLTLEFLRLKGQFFPGLMPATGHYLDRVKAEVKGADIRHDLCHSRRNVRRHRSVFLNRFVSLLEQYDARIMGRIIIKPIGGILRSRPLYTLSVQAVCEAFQHLLTSLGDHGLVIADSRTKPQNAIVSHSIFTQMFSTAGDRYDRLLEMPTYGHSENHVGIQITDLLCSALLFPMAIHAYCTGHVNNLHVRARYSVLKPRFGARLRALQYRYVEQGHHRGGIRVSDRIANRGPLPLFV